jgi:negative regulator of flagellin synthesis FlgM
MSQKIDGTTPHSPVQAPSRPRPAADPSKTARRESAGDTLDLTDTARLLQRLEALVDAAPSTDRARVEAIKQAVASGVYEVEPERIAAQVVRLERELFGRS